MGRSHNKQINKKQGGINNHKVDSSFLSSLLYFRTSHVTTPTNEQKILSLHYLMNQLPIAFLERAEESHPLVHCLVMAHQLLPSSCHTLGSFDLFSTSFTASDLNIILFSIRAYSTGLLSKKVNLTYLQPLFLVTYSLRPTISQ